MSCFVYKYIFIIYVYVIKNMGKKFRKKFKEIYVKYFRSLIRIGKV